MNIIKLGADWCAPCSATDKLLTEAGINYTKVDIDKEPEVAAKFNIRSIPQIFVMNGDTKISQISGLPTKVQIVELKKISDEAWTIIRN